MSWFRSVDLTGKRFGRLLVIERVGTRGRSVLWKCRCDCGNEKEIVSGSLINGNTKSCGCLQAQSAKEKHTTHGMKRTRIYNTWAKMIQRCNNQNEKCYQNYGGRGIRVCDNWSEFIPFYSWAMKNGYDDSLSIDRINNDGNYEASNCKFSTSKEQANNRRGNVFYEYQGEIKTLSQWSDVCKASRDSLLHRIKAGWTIEKALLTPARKYKKTQIGDNIMIKLKELRRKAKLTQKQFAALLGCGQSTLCQWENNRSVPGARWLQPIADALHCEVTDLFPEPEQFVRGH